MRGQEAFGDQRMRQANFYPWFNRFSDGNENVEDEPRSRVPKIACTHENIEEVERLVMQDSTVGLSRSNSQ